MAHDFDILEFAGLSENHPWELSQATPTDLRAVVTGGEPISMEELGKKIATFVGDTIDAEEIDPPDGDVAWAMRVRIEDLPTDIVLWVEPLAEEMREASEVDSGWILAMQTILHTDDPLTHFSNLMRLLGSIDLPIHSVWDLPTGRWFPKEIIDSVFVQDDTEPREEVLWITRLVEAPQGGDPEDRWAWVSTFGLSRCGRVELEMLGVPAVVSSEAVHLVDGLAALTLETFLPPAGQPVSLGSDLVVSLMECEKAIPMLEDGMPGNETRQGSSVVITSHDGTMLYPHDALHILHLGETTVMRTTRSTKRQAGLASSQWNLFITAAKRIGNNEHATCLVQVPWANTDDEDAPREYLWFRVVGTAQQSVTGELAHKPAMVTSLQEGHQEEIERDDISDWVLMTPVGPLGPSDTESIKLFLKQI